MTKVHHLVKHEQLGATPCNVAGTAEISIDLPGKGVGAKQDNKEIWLAKLACEDGIREQSAIISNDALAEQTREDQQDAIEEVALFKMSIALNLWKQMARSLN